MADTTAYYMNKPKENKKACTKEFFNLLSRWEELGLGFAVSTAQS
tara:strand:+ start:348 stop:482 length:135 start_codon:yes stop_codon:yes gene_type:complete